MSLTSSPHPFAFGRIAPTLPVADIARALAFYVGVMGFAKTFENGTPVGFVILKKDAAELHLSLDRSHKPDPRNLAHLLVDDAAGLYAHLQQADIRIIKALRDADYGLRGFVFADPDGNRIDVGQRL
ncbi:VOC family protein [Pseudoxanthomonas winnipegensis]|uniref:VOC family protein n=1 Tax=Pseudoxanthomonas winnipegensis TaxID=2480810 RepID=UPI0025773B4F|nr:VOC family protein [Pseudoxanthomonas winnipegensis]WJI16775.1 VOC family protein [Pseudoxanthomonas winnipegensis]